MGRCLRWRIANISPKSRGKGSLLLPCSKMPIGIFLFALKSEFQKSEENGVKRRKPEKISGFSVGIFFVKTHWDVLTKKMPPWKWRNSLYIKGFRHFLIYFSKFFSSLYGYLWKTKSWQKECLCFPPTNYNWSIGLLYHILWTFQTLEFIRFDGFHTVKPNFIIRP